MNVQLQTIPQLQTEPIQPQFMSVKYTEASRPIVESNRLIEACHERGIVAERLFGEKEILREPALCGVAVI